jgi:hypothetical protein
MTNATAAVTLPPKQPKAAVQQNTRASMAATMLRQYDPSLFPTLALLWQIFGEEFLTVRALSGWRTCEEIEDGLPDGRHARLWRWSPASFFSVPLL